jgi:hypothetical protein
VHTGANEDRIKKKRRKPANKGSQSRDIQEVFCGDAFKIIPMPTVAAGYNDEMNHVDRGDQLRAYTIYEH